MYKGVHVLSESNTQGASARGHDIKHGFSIHILSYILHFLSLLNELQHARAWADTCKQNSQGTHNNTTTQQHNNTTTEETQTAVADSKLALFSHPSCNNVDA